jgi:hypothetical protein
MLLFVFLESASAFADVGTALLRLAGAIAGVGVVLGRYVLKPK